MVQLLKKGFAALVAVLVGITAFAQVTTSSLNGKVTDANGAPVPGAAVVAVCCRCRRPAVGADGAAQWLQPVGG